ncbi:MAG: Na/Pi cotransporter family protein [Lachnospiraceae bacterium]|nr:Na/Pi cotransporter family protein [Lachnospiraceae bacterium]
MNIFSILSLFGGLAMFLYGMRLMGDGLKESSSGVLKAIMEKATNNFFKAFVLGVAVTAIIQSSTATIVITSGLVAAGIISLRQSLGIVIGANIGTTVTGQIIRLLDIDSSSTGWLQIFKPSTLAPVALIIGIVLIMGFSSLKNSRTVGNIAIGFGILFSGLINMTGSVNVLVESGKMEKLFTGFGGNPVMGYLTGAGVAFVLQSSSATIGILQAFSASGALKFNAVYAIIVGVYLGDCVTTAIVCSIGAKADARRVGTVDIMYNLSKTILVFVILPILRATGLLDGIWNMTATSGVIANTHSIINICSAFFLFPLVPVYEKLSKKIIKDDSEEKTSGKYAELLESLNPAFFKTPALALQGCFSVLDMMFKSSRTNIGKAMDILEEYDEEKWKEISEEEINIDMLADRVSNYLVQLSSHVTLDEHVAVMDQYYKLVTEFERLGDHAMNIGESAGNLHMNKLAFSHKAQNELAVTRELIERILDQTEKAFEKKDIVAAQHIEPLEEVVDDLVEALRNRHLERLRKGSCSIDVGVIFMNLLVDIERISDICSNVGVAVVARVMPELMGETHDYIYHLHSGDNQAFNEEYRGAHDQYFSQLDQIAAKPKKADKPEKEEKVDKASKTDKSSKSGKSAKADKTGKQAKPSKTDKKDKTDKSKNTKSDKDHNRSKK